MEPQKLGTPLLGPGRMTVLRNQRKTDFSDEFTQKNLSSISVFDGNIEVWKLSLKLPFFLFY